MTMTVGTHARRRITRKADAVLTDHNLLVKEGTDADHFALNGAGEKPLGTCPDMPDTVEESYTVQLLGGPDTDIMVAGAAVAHGDELYPMANGRVGNEATVGAGATYRVGRALSAATEAGEEIEVEGEKPVA